VCKNDNSNLNPRRSICQNTLFQYRATASLSAWRSHYTIRNTKLRPICQQRSPVLAMLVRNIDCSFLVHMLLQISERIYLQWSDGYFVYLVSSKICITVFLNCFRNMCHELIWLYFESSYIVNNNHAMEYDLQEPGLKKGSEPVPEIQCIIFQCLVWKEPKRSMSKRHKPSL
jgi:hypothetical protein